MTVKSTEPPSSKNTDGTVQKPERGLSWLLDSSIPLPGGYRIGLDGIIGLIPGVGDAIGGGLSTWFVYQAVIQNVPKMIIARMVINIFIDSLVGAIPIVGDIFDFYWKANLKNAALLENYKRQPKETYKRSALTTVIFFAGLVLVAGLFIYLLTMLVGWVWQTAIGPKSAA